MKKKKLKNIKTKNLFYKIISIALAISSICLLSLLFYINLLPSKYLILIFFVILIFNIFNIFLVNIKNLKKKIKKIISVIMIFAIILISFANFYIGKTLGVLVGNGDNKYKLEHYSVIVLKDSEYENLKDIDSKTVGYFKNSTGSSEANAKLEEKVNLSFEGYKNSDILAQDLLDSNVEVIIVEDSIKNIMKEEIKKFKKLTKVIYTFTIKTKVETTLKEVKVTKEPFAVYISGIDTYGEISSVSRSDVNMVMVINPKTYQVLLISIPRDYYVQLHGTTGTKDKLTHAGIYGIDMSIQTIEDLLETDINYYVKVNFTSVIDIVDALGGLDVYSEYTFTSYSGFSFKKGLNSVNGEQALDFARTRKAFSDGDRQRGKNQQAVIEAIIRKATNKSIITKYNSLLNAIDGKYQTNMSMKNITNLLKLQLKNMPSWNVTSYSLTGSDSKNYTYTYNQLLYVMSPDQDSVNEAIKLIDTVMNGDKLETTYTDVSGSSNKVTKKQSSQVKQTNVKKEESKQTQEQEESDEDIVKETIKPDIEPEVDNPKEDLETDNATSEKVDEEQNVEISKEETSNDEVSNVDKSENSTSTQNDLNKQ